MPQLPSSRHPCFALTSAADLVDLQKKIWAHYKEGSKAGCLECDEPGQENTGSKVSRTTLLVWVVGCIVVEKGEGKEAEAHRTGGELGTEVERPLR
jgi:hypothetical protein